MTAFRKILQWMVVLLVLAGAAGGSYAWWIWSQSDELLRQGVLDALDELAPHWNVQIRRARFDWRGAVRLYDFTITPRGGSTAVVSLPEVVLDVDRELLTSRQQISVRSIRLIRPSVHLVRDASGSWNWQELAPFPKTDRSLPEWNIEQGSALFEFQHFGGDPPARLRLSAAAFSLIPEGRRQLAIEGATEIDGAGVLHVSDTSLDLEQGTWSFNGGIRGLNVRPELLPLLAGCSPELQRKLTELDERIAEYGRELVPPGEVPAVPQDPGASGFSLTALVDLNIRIAQATAETDPDWHLLATIRTGELTSPLLPFPLQSLKGKVDADQSGITLSELAAENGVTRVQLDGRLPRAGRKELTIGISDLVLDERLRARLPRSCIEMYDDCRLSGRGNVRLELHSVGDSPWTTVGSFTALRCSLSHEQFAYPIREITGSATLKDGVVEIELKGRAGQRPIALTGFVRNPGPEAAILLDVHVQQLPLDATFLAACPVKVQDVVRRLNIRGHGDGHLRLMRRPGPEERFEPTLRARLRDCSISYEKFPYRLTNLNGTVILDPNGTWSIENAQARHDGAQLTGSGKFVPGSDEEAARLDLAINALGATFDKQLELAAPQSLQAAWDELSPEGTFNLESTIVWIPGEPVAVRIARLTLVQAGILMKSFPYAIHDIQAELAYDDGIVTIRSFRGRHDDTQMTAEGIGRFSADGWRVRLENLHIDDLNPNAVFRRALPDGLRRAVESLNPHGNMSLSGEIELGTGGAQRGLTAEWNTRLVLSDVTLQAGLELRNVSGAVQIEGAWDGRSQTSVGRLDLESVNLLETNYQITQVRGPFRLQDGLLTLGSGDVAPPNAQSPSARPAGERITGRAVDGLVTFDAVADLNAGPAYALKATLENGSLERYAERYIRGRSNLRGTMNGWMTLKGNGLARDRMSGQGQFRVDHAALYELPILLQVFKLLRFEQFNRTAFDYAFLDFRVANERFHFDRIDLIGKAVSLHGAGNIRFDGGVSLELASRLSRNSVPVPVLNEIVGQATELVGQATRGWVGVEVRGTVSEPVSQLKPVPQLSDAFRQLLNTFEVAPRGGTPPQLFPPMSVPDWLFPVRPASSQRSGGP